MLTRNQLSQTAKDFKIDQFTVFREYLQLIFLNYLYQEKEAEKIYFKGGTCLRLLYDSPRFSEDLDFSTALSARTLKNLLDKLIKKIQKELPQANLSSVWPGENSLRYKISYLGKEFKYPLNIRLDFFSEKILLSPHVSSITSEIPLNFSGLILGLKPEEILAEKIRAFLLRNKGRDVFDFWYLLQKGTLLNKKIINQKLKKVGLHFDQGKFLQKIKKYPDKKLELDVAKFLPDHYRKIIPLLKEKIEEHFKKGILFAKIDK